MNEYSKYKLPVILVTSLFFLWGFAHNLNLILIPHLKKACQLSDMQSAFIDSAFFIAYFLIAMPAGMFMKKYGYKGGIVFGLLLFAIGAFLFYPAASARNYGLFLLALFVIASGLTFLETAANPYINALGEQSKATTRLNFAQSFKSLAATLASLIGGAVILTDNSITDEAKQVMTSEELNAFLTREASVVQLPYLLIGIVVLLFAVLIWKTTLPEITESQTAAATPIKGSLLKEKNFVRGVVAQFFYVGAQVCVGSFFIRYAGYADGMDEKVAALYLSAALFAFMGGRFIGTFLMQYIAAARLLLLYSLISIGLLVVVVMNKSLAGIYALVALQFFMSIMFPTIFSLSLIGLGEKTKQGSSLLIMAIVGGAVMPLLMGRVSDLFNIQVAYLVPALCFLVVSYFALRLVTNKEAKELSVQLSHN
ncbi:L-fucose:H+ symporter permease [Chitinophagaceae bacterium LB-8]|uniref:L-fucose:H+ symporter permease n=1 Tax=Paraflavisolibacter caeni TaxID=2982496 RepID=A0A9X3BFN1_9BACT|nr:L-fucose:H+ symporter permease [Paraflavisolibacter caeni]MCU7549249.1 L-fucose:H+ symporter permease [Paraflavisolibacter caeni]